MLELTGLIIIIRVQQASAVGNGNLVARVAGSIGGLSIDGENSLAGWDVNLLLVGTRVDENTLGSGGGGAQGVDSILDGRVSSAGTNSDSTGWRGSASCGQHSGDHRSQSKKGATHIERMIENVDQKNGIEGMWKSANELDRKRK